MPAAMMLEDGSHATRGGGGGIGGSGGAVGGGDAAAETTLVVEACCCWCRRRSSARASAVCIWRAVEAALATGRPAVVNVAVDRDALYSFRRDSFKHRGG